MNALKLYSALLAIGSLPAASLTTAAFGQQPHQPRKNGLPVFTPTLNDTLISLEVLPDKRVTFRIYAPQAKSVAVRGEWMFTGDWLSSKEVKPSDNGVWSVTVNPVLSRFVWKCK